MGYEPAVTASERPQTFAFDLVATGIRCLFFYVKNLLQQNKLLLAAQKFKYLLEHRESPFFFNSYMWLLISAKELWSRFDIRSTV